MHGYGTYQVFNDKQGQSVHLYKNTKEKLLRHSWFQTTIHNNPTATWHASFYTSPSTPTHPLWTTHCLIPYWSTSSSENPSTGINTMCSSHYPHFILHIQPLKMELTEGSETSTNHNLTPGRYPKEHLQYSGIHYKAEWFGSLRYFLVLL